MPLIFPAILGVYRYPDTRIFLGPRQQEPRHAVSLYPGDSGQLVMVGLHTHTSRTTKWLGTVRRSRLGSDDSFVIQANSSSGIPLGTEDLRFVDGRFSFSVELAHLQRQAFEWRRSYGPEVALLNGGPNNGGWKLVRVPDGYGPSSDGGAVVAVCRVSNSGSKLLRFRFLGAGEAGGLGGKWEVMAVMSALCIYHTS